MIFIVADMGPICHLVQIGEQAVLAKLVDRVILPSLVANELKDPRAPSEVRQWMDHPPEWVQIHQDAPSNEAENPALSTADQEASLLALLRDEGRKERKTP